MVPLRAYEEGPLVLGEVGEHISQHKVSHLPHVECRINYTVSIGKLRGIKCECRGERGRERDRGMEGGGHRRRGRHCRGSKGRRGYCLLRTTELQPVSSHIPTGEKGEIRGKRTRGRGRGTRRRRIKPFPP